MSKRIIVIVLALALLICFMAIPVAADSADEDLPYIELTKFDNNLIMGIEQGAFYVMGDYGYVLDFSVILGQINAYGYEVTYSYSGNRPNVTGTSFGNTTDNAFNSRYVEGTNLGKIRGTFKGAVGSDFGISFNSSGCYITVHSIRVFVVDNYQVSLSAELYGNGQSVTWNPGSSTSVATTGYGTIEIDTWRNYDVINFSATLGGYGITSVTARLVDNTDTLDDIVIPFEMNYINFSDYDGEHENVLLTMSCDMRGVDPATAPDSTLIISITTAVPTGKYGYIQPTSIYGAVLIESPDMYLPWIKIITLGLSSSVEALFSIDSKLSDFMVSVSSKFDDIKNVLSSSFDDFKTFWNSSLDEKIVSFQEYLLLLEEESLNAQKILWWNDVLEDLNTLVDGVPTDEEITNEMTSAGEQLADLGQQMAAGTPQVSTKVDVSIPEIPDDGSGMLATTMFSFFWGQDYIMKMLLTVVALATLSYVFFGKKG